MDMEFHHPHAQPMGLARSLKLVGSDDDLFGGSTSAADTVGDFTELSGSEDAKIGHRVVPMTPCWPGMSGMRSGAPMLSPSMAVPMPGMPSQAAMTISPHAQQMYCLTMRPDGTQMLMPVSTTQMPAWGQQVQPIIPQHQFQKISASLPEFMSTAEAESNAGNLEARAAALTDYAAEVKAEARRAKAAAVAAARRGRVSTANKGARGERVQADSTTRWADMADQVFHDHANSNSTAASAHAVAPAADDDNIPNDDRTTLMFRNLPNNYNRSTLLHMLDSEGFKATYNLVYLPTDFRNFAGFGYAFVNFESHEDARRAKMSFQGFARWRVPSRKTCDVVWSGPVQGLLAHTERYRNSPVMHDSVPDEYKPAVFEDGIRVPFPEPTKRIRPPRVRRNSAGDDGSIAAPNADHNGGTRFRGKPQ